jgi:hypothetical protein
MKKILGKIFLGKQEEAPAYRFKQRSPRVRIPLLEEARFVAANGSEYPLRNISESGMALVSAEDRFPDEASGDIKIAGESVSVRLVAVRRNGEDVGVSIADGAAGVRALLRRVFGDEFKALEMTEVDSSKQKAVAEGQPKWFYAPGNFELFYVEDAGKLLRLELEWNGNFLAYSFETGLRFGTVDRGVVRDAVEHAKASLVKWESTVTPEHKRKALRLIENVAGIDGLVRQQIQSLLAP